jgi:hypothetical protein
MAAGAGDISQLLSVIADTASLTVNDFISKTIGPLKMLYYLYLDKFHMCPTDLTELVDGLLYLDVKEYILKKTKTKKGK